LSEVPAPYAPGVDREREACIEQAVATYEALMHRVASAHAPEFLGVGVTMSQAKVLYLVQAEPDLRMSDLSARLGVSLSTVSGVVDRLVDQGFLDRRDDPADRRHVVLRITDAGATQLQLFRELNAGQFRALLSHLADADLAIVRQALDLLAAAAVLPGVPAAAVLPGVPAASHTLEGEPA
jgi:DNA-binding MarR family transcriptional regulator